MPTSGQKFIKGDDQRLPGGTIDTHIQDINQAYIEEGKTVYEELLPVLTAYNNI